MKKENIKFKIYNRNKLSAIIEYNKDSDNVKSTFLSNTITCLPKENLTWNDIEKFFKSRICSTISIPEIEFLKKYNGKLVEDFIYIEFI